VVAGLTAPRPLGEVLVFTKISWLLLGLDQRFVLAKPWCILVLGRGVLEDFPVTRWRRSNSLYRHGGKI
jgi:hypothetical protein